MASVRFGNSGAGIFARAGLHRASGAYDVLPTTALLDQCSPMVFCALRNWHDIGPQFAKSFGGNDYSGTRHTGIVILDNSKSSRTTCRE